MEAAAERPGSPELLSSGELFRRHARFVTRFVMRLGVGREDLEDLLQEIFLVVHRNGGYAPGPAKPTTYLAGIAYRLVRTERRKRRSRAFVELDDERVLVACTHEDPESTAFRREDLRQLQAAVDALDEDKRTVFVRSELEGESVVSIARCLGIPLDTAYSRLKAARRLFRESVGSA